MITGRIHFRGALGWLLLIVAGLCWWPVPLRAGPHPVAPAAAKPPAAEQLWLEAEAARKEQDEARASLLFLRIHELYPDAPQAAEALWQGALLQKRIALRAKGADWEKVRDLFRRYLNYYPQAPRAPAAYLEVAVAHYQMRFLREALTYAKLFVKRYPQSELVPLARYWQAKVLTEIGRLGEAEPIFKELAEGADPEMAAKGVFGLGDLLARRGKPAEALRLYQRVAEKKPSFYLDDPEQLGTLGLANLQAGNEERGQEQLIQYLNLVPLSSRRAEAIFALGESYRRQGLLAVARQFYLKALAEAEGDPRVGVLSRFRIAEDRDEQARGKNGVDGGENDPSGDKPYRAVIEGYGKEPAAQEARRDLLARLMARKEYAPAYDLAGELLRATSAPAGKAEVEDLLGRILVARIEELLAGKNYQEVYELYTAEYANVRAYTQGRLLYLVGQAMEALTLYDQAAVVYYRALKLSFAEADKLDLYLRRARVYLVQNDLAAAERLLQYLRELYKNDRALGEVAFYSGRLREAQGRKEEALSFYQTAVKAPTFPEKKGEYAQELLRLLLALDRQEETILALSRFQAEEWLEPALLQAWYGKIAELRRQEKDYRGAVAVYRAALQPGMPQTGEQAQALQLYLGDMLVAAGEVEPGLAVWRQAAAGEKNRYRELAGERLSQREINAKISGMKRIFR